MARIFDGEKEAKVIALALFQAAKRMGPLDPLVLLENKVGELGTVDRAHDSTIGRVLIKTSSSLMAVSAGSSRKANGAFVAAMEDVLVGREGWFATRSRVKRR